MTTPRPIPSSSFVLACNGVPDTPPVSAVSEFLLERRASRLVTIHHPLQPENGPLHRIATYVDGHAQHVRTIRLPSHPPHTFALDPFVPLWPDRADCWIGFNNLAAARGLVQRRLGRAGTVAYWAIDFVPDRFGRGLLTQTYDALDALCCRHVDARFEVSQTALDGRNARHGLSGEHAARAEVAPMGAWMSRVPVAPADAWRRRKVVFLGHHVERQGVGMLLDALELLRRRGVQYTADIAGHGPLTDRLREQARRLGLDEQVRFLGFVESHQELEELVASGSVAVAPYATTGNSFTRYADPSKIRTYMAGGLPVVMTDVPPNAAELSAEGGAELVPFTPGGLADGIARALDSPADWERRRAAALAYARRFDWEQIVGRALHAVGFVA